MIYYERVMTAIEIAHLLGTGKLNSRTLSIKFLGARDNEGKENILEDN